MDAGAVLPQSSLEIVRESLDHQRVDESASGAQSFLLPPLWDAAAAGEQRSSTDVSLRKIEVSSRALDSRVGAEKAVVGEISSNSSKDRVLEVIKDHLRNVRGGKSRGDGGGLLFSELINDRVVEDQDVRDLVRKKSLRMSRRLVSFVLGWCLKVGFWDPVAALLESGLVSSIENPEVVDRIVEDGNIPLVLLCILHVRDVRPMQWLEILKLFLASSKNSIKSFQLQRQIWHQLVSKLIQAAAEAEAEAANPIDIATCINFATAYDNFTAPELCLHILLAVDHDEAVLNAIVSELDASRVAILLRYLNKWLDLYSSKTILRFREDARLIPSLETIIAWVSATLESRYAAMVMDLDLSQELGVTSDLVSLLVSGVRNMRSMEGVLDHLIDQAPLPSEKPGGQSSDHIIEYLDIGF